MYIYSSIGVHVCTLSLQHCIAAQEVWSRTSILSCFYRQCTCNLGKSCFYSELCIIVKTDEDCTNVLHTSSILLNQDVHACVYTSVGTSRKNTAFRPAVQLLQVWEVNLSMESQLPSDCSITIHQSGDWCLLVHTALLDAIRLQCMHGLYPTHCSFLCFLEKINLAPSNYLTPFTELYYIL